MGGHSVPEETIRRRYKAGLRNFFNLYRPIADSWKLYDNSAADRLALIAMQNQAKISVRNETTWKYLLETYSEETN
jgi:predicted ABC-type ATPase